MISERATSARSPERAKLTFAFVAQEAAHPVSGFCICLPKAVAQKCVTLERETHCSKVG